MAEIQSSPTDDQSPLMADWFTPLRFAALLALMIVAAFPDIAFGSASWYKFDYGVLGYPFIQYHRDCFWRGELPLWNPLSNCGAPFLAQWGTMTLYPPSLIYLLLPLPWSLNLFCLLHLFLGGMGMYYLARRWTGHAFGAAAAGMIFVFNGIMLSCLIWPNYLAVLAWMPWLVLTSERAWRDGGRWIIVAGVIGALQVLTGSPELVLFTWFVLTLMAAGLLFLKRIPAKKLLPRIAIVLLVIAGLTAAQMLPFVDLLAHSQRDRTFATTKWAMPGWGWGNLLVPLFHYFMTPQGNYFQTDQSFLSSYYVGIAVLALAVLAVWRMRERRVWLLATITLFSLIMAMGENGYVYALLRQAIPVVGIARYPIKFVLLTALTFPLLAAYGLRWCQKNGGSPYVRTSLFTVGGTLAGMALLVLLRASENRFTYDQWPVTGQNTVQRLICFGIWLVVLALQVRERRKLQAMVLGFALLLIPAMDSLTHQPRQNPTLPADVYVPGMVREKFAFNPMPAPGQSRVFITPFVEDQLLRSNIPNPTNDFLIKRFALWSNLNAVEGIPKLNGSSTLQIKEQADIQKLFYATNHVELPRLLDFLAVSHTTPTNQLFPWTNRVTALPWISAGQKPQPAEPRAILAAITNSAFDPQAEVYLENATGLNAQSARATIAGLVVQSSRKEFTVTADANTVVVIAESFYHPWKAFVDEQPVTLLRANYAFQAISVPQGQHRVRLVYHDVRFIAGAWISALTLAACVLGWFGRGRRRLD